LTLGFLGKIRLQQAHRKVTSFTRTSPAGGIYWLKRKNNMEMKRKKWKKIHFIRQDSRKEQKNEKKCLMAGFPPLIEGDFQAGDFGWEVER